MADSKAEIPTSPPSLADFLESGPPNTYQVIPGIVKARRTSYEGTAYYVKPPDIQLHCPSEACGGTRIHRCDSGDVHIETGKNLYFVTYVCRHCDGNKKTYALAFSQKDNDSATVLKIGEDPPFGPHVPSRVISLIGPDRDLFLSGRRAENQGFGIGAHAYYRRVVENQWGRIIEEIGKVADRLGAAPAIQKLFEQAAKEDQFSKAIDLVKNAIPESLKINGQNPLTLLHSALSEGLHNLTDAEYLEMAADIRVVLTELADRISQALKDEAELSAAVSRLQSRTVRKSEAKAAVESDGEKK